MAMSTDADVKVYEPTVTSYGIQEFSAPPGVVYIPYHVMEGLGIDQGDTVTIELTSPPDGSYIKLQPHKTEFINLYDPKAILEKVLSKDYPVVQMSMNESSPVEKLLFNASSFLDTNIKEKHSLSLFRPPIHS